MQIKSCVFRAEATSKDQAFNKVLELLKSLNCGFQASQVTTLGKKVVSTLTSVLWYISPHFEKFAARGISLPCQLMAFDGIYQWKKQHKKTPMVQYSKY